MYPQILFDPAVDDYIPVVSNSRDRYIEFVMRGENKIGAFYNTGIFMIHNEKQDPIIRFSNTQKLHEDGYLDRFFAICDENPSYFPFNQERGSIIEFSEAKHGETVRAILDDNDLTDLSKIAAIISYTVFFPSLSMDSVLAAARNQIPAENAEIKSFSTLKYFLIPDFIFTSSSESFNNRDRGQGHNYRLFQASIEGSFLDFLKLSKFVSTVDDLKETFEEFKLKHKEDTLIPITTNCYDFVKESHSLINALRGSLDKIEGLNRKEIRRVVTFSSLISNPEFVEDLQKNHREDVTIARESLMDSNLTEKEKKNLRDSLKCNFAWRVLSNFLSVGEIREVAKVFEKTSLVEGTYMENHMALFMSNIFVYLGPSKLEEFILFVKEYEGKNYQSYGTFSLPTNSVKSYRELYLKLLEGDYSEYPVSWVAELV